MMFVGYHEPEDFPIKRGDRVLIPKGVLVYSTHPQRKGPDARAIPARKPYEVTIHSFMTGRSIVVGHRYRDRPEPFYTGNSEGDLLHYAQILGIDIGNRQAAIEELYRRAVERTSNWDAMTDLVIHLENPRVRWAGSGGYWYEADINDLLGK